MRRTLIRFGVIVTVTFSGLIVLGGTVPGTGLAVVLWETEEVADAAAANRNISAARVKLGALGLAIEARQIYEVVAHDWPRPDPVGIPVAGSPPP